MGTNKKPDNKIWRFKKKNPQFGRLKASEFTSFSDFRFSISLFGETSPVNKMAAISDRDCVFCHTQKYLGWLYSALR
jgi:hypothetical protein